MADESLVLSTEILLEESSRLTLVELCEVCRVSADSVLEMVEEGIVEPEGSEPIRWRFSTADLKRMRMALRLQRDLRVNLPGVALALDLIEELETLRRRLIRESLSNQPR